MTGRNGLRASFALVSASASWSSRNLRNMIQVRSGSRSRSPLSPLSLRMMSRADLSRLPSACAVVGGGASFLRAVDLRGIQMTLKFGYGQPELLGAAEEADDVAH